MTEYRVPVVLQEDDNDSTEFRLPVVLEEHHG